jgi:hypothetical protein
MTFGELIGQWCTRGFHSAHGERLENLSHHTHFVRPLERTCMATTALPQSAGEDFVSKWFQRSSKRAALPAGLVASQTMKLDKE